MKVPSFQVARQFPVRLWLAILMGIAVVTGMPNWELPSAFRFPAIVKAATVTVVPATSPTPSDNDFTRINNALQTAASGDVISLQGTFNWTELNAAASWALGSDGIAATGDDYSLRVPAINNLTITAPSLGAATIQGPGDLPNENLETFLIFDVSGTYNQLTVSNLRILDFDLSIGMFFGGPVNKFDNTVITNNYIRIPTDLNSVAAPVDVNQNIGIHFAFGVNQQITNNQIDIPGSGIGDVGGARPASIGMQSNTSGGAVYDGLVISGNIIRVLNAPSALPETILGIWENSFGNTSDILVANNRFLNLAAGNNPALNVQRAFRCNSQSSATTTVRFTGNLVTGANVGFQFVTSNPGQPPLRLESNTFSNVEFGYVLGADNFGSGTGAFHLSNCQVLGDNSPTSVGILVRNASSVILDGDSLGSPGPPSQFIGGNTISNFGTGIVVNGTGNGTGGTLDMQDTVVSSNGTGVSIGTGAAAVTLGTGAGGNNCFLNQTGPAVNSVLALNAQNNWWGMAGGPTVGGGPNQVGANVTFIPFLTAGCAAMPGSGSGLLTGLYVADTLNHRVQVFDGMAWTVLGVGTPGTGNGQFRLPEAVAADLNQRIYVADTGNNRIQWSTDGGMSWENFATIGTGLNQVRAPQGLALDTDGNLYVSDTGNRRVLRFDDGVPGNATVIASSGAASGQVGGPHGLAVDSAFRLFVADESNSRILRITDANTVTTAITGTILATSGVGLNKVRNPQGITIDTGGTLYVADTGNSRLLRWVNGNPNNSSSLAFAGAQLGQVNRPEGVTVTQFLTGPFTGGPFLVVGDTFNNRVQGRFLPTGNWTLVGAPNNSGSNPGQFRNPGKIQ